MKTHSIIITLSLLGQIITHNGLAQELNELTEPNWKGQIYVSKSGIKFGAVCTETLSSADAATTQGCAIWKFFDWSGLRAKQIGTEISVRSLPPSTSLSEIFLKNSSCSKTSADLLVKSTTTNGAPKTLPNKKFEDLVQCAKSLPDYSDPKSQANDSPGPLKVGADGLTDEERNLLTKTGEEFTTALEASAGIQCRGETKEGSLYLSAAFWILGNGVDEVGAITKKFVWEPLNAKSLENALKHLISRGLCRPFGSDTGPNRYRLPQLVWAAQHSKFDSCRIDQLSLDSYAVVQNNRILKKGDLPEVATYFLEKLINKGKCHEVQ